MASLPFFYATNQRRYKTNYTLRDMIEALTKRIHYVALKSKSFISSNPDDNVYNENADFEQIIENSIDVVKITNMLKYADQKMILVYKAVGYANWEISHIMGISERTVVNRLISIKRFLREVSS